MTFFSFDLLRVVSSAIVKLIRFRLHRDGKERDRILTCVGAGSIPNNRGSNLERPAKAAGRSSRFVAQSLRLGVSPKKCRLVLLLAENNQPSRARIGDCGRALVSRFLRSQLRRIGPGHPPGRDPVRTSMRPSGLQR